MLSLSLFRFRLTSSLFNHSVQHRSRLSRMNSNSIKFAIGSPCFNSCRRCRKEKIDSRLEEITIYLPARGPVLFQQCQRHDDAVAWTREDEVVVDCRSSVTRSVILLRLKEEEFFGLARSYYNQIPLPIIKHAVRSKLKLCRMPRHIKSTRVLTI
ncbi:unnamed protein product [Vicia faba]|uniref:Uncharacterized protein n=1 Tax=Vicia faba TaxID=3906 RepID=A0AAV0YEL1_VICFA|nr:unnamed protein product [Vicia faba]